MNAPENEAPLRDAPPVEAPTRELVQRAQGGDPAAREELFARYSGRALSIARVRLGARLRGVLESTDILQEALAEAVRGLERFEMHDESSLIRWMALLIEHRITARASYHGAAKRAVASVSLDDQTRGDQTEELELPSNLPSPSTELVTREREDAVHAALAALPAHYRELVLLRDYAGASWDEIAREVKAPSASAARMMHARAVARLGALMRERKGGP